MTTMSKERLNEIRETVRAAAAAKAHKDSLPKGSMARIEAFSKAEKLEGELRTNLPDLLAYVEFLERVAAQATRRMKIQTCPYGKYVSIVHKCDECDAETEEGYGWVTAPPTAGDWITCPELAVYLSSPDVIPTPETDKGGE